MFRIVQAVFFILGILLILGSDRLSIPLLIYGGVACFALMAMAVGWEAILTRQIMLGNRRSGDLETYVGGRAVLQGIQFNLIGFFLLGVTAMVYLNNGRDIFLQFVRRPGVPLATVGLLMLLQALVIFLGYREINEGPGWMVTINLLFSRMFPGVLLLLLGLGVLGLGFLDILAPAVFDAMGGGFVETLYAP